LNKHLHIVAHDVPWPADYGGAIDVFYKIKALHALGVKVHLHCFTGSRKPQKELEQYCVSVQYYSRKRKLAAFSLKVPYIVQSRRDVQLLKDLSNDQYPILLDCIHCTYLLHTNQLKDRKVFVRPQNVEYRYYNQLAKHETNIVKKIYFAWESRLLKGYERSIANKAVFWPLNQQDLKTYQEEFGVKRADFLPAFVGWDAIDGLPDKGCFCLYQGNLSINENEKAADWLLNHVFNNLEIPFVVAGKDPSLPLQTLAHSHAQSCMVINPSNADMEDMVRKAQVNIIPSFNETGVKLKLLHALFHGRHCLVNPQAVAGSGLETLCHIATTEQEFKKEISRLFDIPFTASMRAQRMDVLKSLYNNEQNARQLIAWIY